MHLHWITRKYLWLLAGGAVGFLASTGATRTLPRLRPVVVGAVKEVYAWKEWAACGLEKIKENVEDIVAEAKHAYYQETGAEAGMEPEAKPEEPEAPERA